MWVGIKLLCKYFNIQYLFESTVEVVCVIYYEGDSEQDGEQQRQGRQYWWGLTVVYFVTQT